MSTRGGTVDAAAARPAAPHRSAWALTWSGVRTVAVLELRQRVRSTRWIVALIVWFVVVGGITALATGSVSLVSGGSDGTVGDATSPLVPGGPTAPAGPVIFGFVVFFVLFLGLLVAPTLSATSINGDRNAGTLATLQVTLLSAAEIVIGKLAASWLAALAFLGASLPFIAWALAAGGVRVMALVVTVLVLALILAVVCAIGLGFSALTARTSGSAVLTYLTVAGLSAVTLILFGLTVPLVNTHADVKVYGIEGWDSELTPECSWFTETRTVVHTERTWWLLALNPFVIVADAAPATTSQPSTASFDPLSAIRTGVRYARTGPQTVVDECWTRAVGDVSPVPERQLDAAPVWPWGVGAYLLIGAGSVAVAVRRLRVPQKALPRGTRVA
ncbi:MAG TPA: ABC transporter permease subunit [Cellulomonadaceae bacterium]|nr:ABC transporter permease subunit [Cellulomonadaceae bacterium]